MSTVWVAYYMMLAAGIFETGEFEEEIKITIRLNLYSF